jgi:hypothetical protein
MKNFYKNDQVIIHRKNINDAIIRKSYDGTFLLDIYRVNKDVDFRLNFKTEAEALAELNRLYEFLAPRYDRSLVTMAGIVLAIALATYAFWIPS